MLIESAARFTEAHTEAAAPTTHEITKPPVEAETPQATDRPSGGENMLAPVEGVQPARSMSEPSRQSPPDGSEPRLSRQSDDLMTSLAGTGIDPSILTRFGGVLRHIDASPRSPERLKDFEVAQRDLESYFAETQTQGSTSDQTYGRLAR